MSDRTNKFSDSRTEGSNEAVTLNPVGFGTLSGMGIGTIEDAKNTLNAVLEEIKGWVYKSEKLEQIFL